MVAPLGPRSRKPVTSRTAARLADEPDGRRCEGHSPSQASGSTPLILPVTIRLNMRAARRPPRSDPQKSWAGFGTARADAAWDRNHRRKRSLLSTTILRSSRLVGGFAYVAVILDAWSRRAVGSSANQPFDRCALDARRTQRRGRDARTRIRSSLRSRRGGRCRPVC